MFFFRMFKKITPIFALLFTAAVSLGSSSLDDESIYDLMMDHSEIETITTITTDSEMHRHLHHDGPFTILAPTDEAMDNLPADELGELMQDNVAQRDFLNNHMFQGEHTAEDIAHVVEDGEIVEEHQAENGILLIIDTVIEEAE